MKRGMSLWDVLAWIILAAILFWTILKIFGIINTPPLLEYAPYFGAIYLAGWAMHKLETAVDNISSLKSFAGDTAREINNIKLKCVKNHPN